MKTTTPCLCILGLTAAANAGGTLMDHIGANDGSDLIAGTLSANQIFETANEAYSTVCIDDFDNSGGSSASSVSLIVGGWNGYLGIDGIQGLSANFYDSPEAAGTNLVGYASVDVMGAPTGDPDWSGADTALLTVVGSFAVNSGIAWVGLIPINEYGVNGQTGAAQSNLGDAIAWQCNPGGGFGFGGTQVVGASIALRVASGAPGDPCATTLREAPCNADVDNDNVVGVEDLLAVIGTFGEVGDGSARPLGDCAPLPTGDCVVNVEDVLAVIGGFGADCTPVDPTGSCCMSNGDCSTYTEAACNSMGGSYLGDDSDCSTCINGACCYDDGTCAEVNDTDCTGTFVGGSCADANCQPILGACCLGPQTCLDNLTPLDCEAFAGEFAGDGSSCLDAPCGWPGCSATDTPEGLPCQGDTTAGDFYDENGGTNSDPPAYGMIADGETICGTMSTFLCIGCAADGTDVTYRDTDWYRFDNAEGGQYTIRGGGEGALIIGVIQISAGAFVDYALTESHAQAEVTVTIGAGDDYAVFVSHDWNAGDNVPCDSGQNEYSVSLFSAAAPPAACCLGLNCAGDLVPLDCDALGGTYVPGESCDSYACPEAYEACSTGYGQDPETTNWWGGTSDSTVDYTRYEDINAPTITNLRAWGITAVYDGGWSACSDMEMNFDVASYEDDGAGAPGNMTGELVGWVGDQAPLDVNLGSYILRRFDFPLQATVPSRWIKVVSNGNGCWFLWVASSEAGAGTSLVETGGVLDIVDRDLAYCITP